MNRSLHSGRDWCYICGLRRDCDLVQFYYSKNAENFKKDESQYIRICKVCIEESLIVVKYGDCPDSSYVHQFAVYSIDPPKSECQNCGMIVDSLELSE